MVEFESVSWDKLNYQRDDFKLKPVLKYFGTFFLYNFAIKHSAVLSMIFYISYIHFDYFAAIKSPCPGFYAFLLILSPYKLRYAYKMKCVSNFMQKIKEN